MAPSVVQPSVDHKRLHMLAVDGSNGAVVISNFKRDRALKLKMPKKVLTQRMVVIEKAIVFVHE
jgi:hypothetical protein